MRRTPLALGTLLLAAAALTLTPAAGLAQESSANGGQETAAHDAKASADNGGKAAAANDAAEPMTLDGTWYVVVHYRDSHTANPDADRWEDKVWVFQRKGSRLHWTEYPIVVFDDRSGRFEARAGNRRARTLEKWEPNDAQRAEIADGPRVNTRGSKEKSLRGSDTKGYESMGGLRAQSATVIGYHETWVIEDPVGLPVFSRTDVLGMGRSARTGGDEQNMDGVTRYATLERIDADTLRGRYARDESKAGEFVMMRAGAVRGLKTDGRTPNEKARDRAAEAIAEEVQRRAAEGDPEAIEAIREYQRQQRGR